MGMRTESGVIRQLQKSNLLASSAIVGAALITTPAVAQVQANDTQVAADTGETTPNEGLQENVQERGASSDNTIIVTAQRREQAVQDVGISIAAFSGEQLARQGVMQSTDVVQLTPGITTGGNSAGQFQQFSIRGVTQNDVTDIIEPPNAVYIDEGYMPSAQTQVFGLFDIQRVEVLRGPQGTLFGRNATGGLVHFVTNKPTDYLDGYLDATVGSYNQVRLEGAISGPLGANLSGRLSGTFNRFDDVLENIYPQGQTSLPSFGPLPGSAAGATDFWGEESWAVRGQLLWEAGNADLLLSSFYAESTMSSSPYQSQATTAVFDDQGRLVNSVLAKTDPLGCVNLSTAGTCLGGTRPVQGGDYFGYVDPDGSGLRTSADFAGDDFSYVEAYGGTANLTWDLGAVTLTSISHYVHSFKHLRIDADASPTPVAVINAGPTTTESFTQELRASGEAGPLTWVAGLYYLYNEVDYNLTFSFGETSPITLLFVPGQIPTDGISSAVLTTNSYSGFGQLEYELTDKFTVIGGLRLIVDRQNYDYYGYTALNQDDLEVEFDSFLFESRPRFVDSREMTLWAGKLQLNYEPNDDLLLYVGVNRGAKAGSYNAQAIDGNPTLDPSRIPFKPEALIAYEGGVKVVVDAGTTINAGAFYYDYQDYHAFTYTPGSISGFTTNRDARYWGFEVEALVEPTGNLFLSAGLAYIDAKVMDVGVTPGIILDRKPAFTPEVQLSGSARYELPNAIAGGLVAFQMSGYYQSSSYYNIQNFDSQKLDAYALGNARISWTSSDEVWELAAFVNNFTDTRNEIQGFDFSTLCGCSEIAYGKPRWYGIQVRLRPW